MKFVAWWWKKYKPWQIIFMPLGLIVLPILWIIVSTIEFYEEYKRDTLK